MRHLNILNMSAVGTDRMMMVGSPMNELVVGMIMTQVDATDDTGCRKCFKCPVCRYFVDGFMRLRTKVFN